MNPCPYDGFPRFIDESEREKGWQCMNPLHPLRPRCPRCQQRAYTELGGSAGIAAPAVEVLCRSCCHVWDEPRRAAA